MQEIPDTDLVGRAQAGELDAFAELYSRHFDAIYDFQARLVGDGEEAARATQATFQKAMATMGGVQAGATFRSFLFGLARGVALNRLEETPRGPVDRPIYSQVDAAEGKNGTAAAPAVWAAAASLDPKQLSVLDLDTRQGLESGEIAGVLGVSARNGALTVERVRKAAGEAMDSQLPGGDEPGTSLAVYSLLLPVEPPAELATVAWAGLAPEWSGRLASPAIGPPPLVPGGPGTATAAGGFWNGRAARMLVMLGVLAAVLGLFLVAPFSPLSLTRGDGDEPNAAVAPFGTEPTETPEATTGPGTPTRTRVPGQTATSSGTPGADETETPDEPTETVPPGSTATNTPQATPTGTLTATPTRTPTVPAPTPTPCVPTLTPNVSLVRIVPPGQSAITFQLTNGSCVSSSFSLSATQSWVTASSSQSTVAGFDFVLVNVLVDVQALPGAEGVATAQIAINVAGGADSMVVVEVIRGGNPPTIASACYSASEGLITVGALDVQDDYSGVAGVTATLSNSETGETTAALGYQGANDWSLQVFGPGWTGVSITATDNAGLSRTYPLVPCGG